MTRCRSQAWRRLKPGARHGAVMDSATQRLRLSPRGAGATRPGSATRGPSTCDDRPHSETYRALRQGRRDGAGPGRGTRSCPPGGLPLGDDLGTGGRGRRPVRSECCASASRAGNGTGRGFALAPAPSKRDRWCRGGSSSWVVGRRGGRAVWLLNGNDLPSDRSRSTPKCNGSTRSYPRPSRLVRGTRAPTRLGGGE